MRHPGKARRRCKPLGAWLLGRSGSTAFAVLRPACERTIFFLLTRVIARFAATQTQLRD
jgi:hypothetical protein